MTLLYRDLQLAVLSTVFTVEITEIYLLVQKVHNRGVQGFTPLGKFGNLGIQMELFFCIKIDRFSLIFIEVSDPYHRNYGGFTVFFMLITITELPNLVIESTEVSVIFMDGWQH